MVGKPFGSGGGRYSLNSPWFSRPGLTIMVRKSSSSTSVPFFPREGLCLPLLPPPLSDPPAFDPSPEELAILAFFFLSFSFSFSSFSFSFSCFRFSLRAAFLSSFEEVSERGLALAGEAGGVSTFAGVGGEAGEGGVKRSSNFVCEDEASFFFILFNVPCCKYLEKLEKITMNNHANTLLCFYLSLAQWPPPTLLTPFRPRMRTQNDDQMSQLHNN